MRLENNKKGLCLVTTELRTIELDFLNTGLTITALAGREFTEAVFKTPFITDTYVPQFKTLAEGRQQQKYAARYVNVNKALEAQRLPCGDMILQKQNYLKKRHTLICHYRDSISIKLYVGNNRKRVDIDLKDKIEIQIKILKYIRENEMIIGEKKLACYTVSIPETKT
jgi:hypothetical protein